MPLKTFLGLHSPCHCLITVVETFLVLVGKDESWCEFPSLREVEVMPPDRLYSYSWRFQMAWNLFRQWLLPQRRFSAGAFIQHPTDLGQ
eukprot:jgi/Botrbrau1/20687/Bobra.0058s0017.1